MWNSRSIIIAISLSIVFFLSAGADAKTIKMGFVGGRDALGGVRQWAPLTDYLSREMGIPIEMVMREDYTGLIESLKNGEIDLYEGGAFSHVTAMDTGVAELLVGEIRRGKETYRSVFAVRADGEFDDMSDLRGARLALTDRLSTSGYLVPMITLARQGISAPDNYFHQIVLTGTHERSMEALLENAVDVIAIGDFFIEQLPESERGKFKTIAVSDEIPNGPVTVRKDLDDSLKRRLKDALLRYDAEIPTDVKKIVEIDKFVTQSNEIFEPVKKYIEEFKGLPNLAYVVPPYQRIPTVVAEKISSLKTNALIWMVGSFMILILILIGAWFKMRNRISTSIGVAVAAFVALLAGFFTAIQMVTLYSALNSYSMEKLGKLENANLRSIALIEGGQERNLGKILENLSRDGAIAYSTVTRYNTIIASSNQDEIGKSIVGQIRAGTYTKRDLNSILVQDPIIVDGRRYATLNVGLSFAEVADMTSRAIAVNIILMFAVLITGLVTALVSRKHIRKPLKAIESAIEKIRDGEAASIERTDSEVGGLVKSISELGHELAEKQKLLDLKACEADERAGSMTPEIIEELKARIEQIEASNEAFRHIRMTEAIGQSPSWLRTLRDAAIRARDKDPAVIYGPTGSGKTGVARVVHALSRRSDKPFAEFNCAEFASGDPLVVLGKLFGYGANAGITGIDPRGQKGILEQFNGGTIFFDEIQVLPPQAQQLLLLPLEGRPFNPAAGRGVPRTSDVRFIFATNEPLEGLVHSGRMRKDLLRRVLARGVIKVDPLAKRSSDIEMLAMHFLSRRNSTAEKRITFDPVTLTLINQYSFDKYNVSELAGVIDEAFDRASFEGTQRIEERHMRSEILRTFRISKAHNSEGGQKNDVQFDDEEKGELGALRLLGFNITKAEKRLGYATGSKTLTNRFRGLAYKALDIANWDTQRATGILMGDDANQLVAARLRKKIEDYITTARRHLESGSTDKLFNNLPLKYHHLVDKMLYYLRGVSMADGANANGEHRLIQVKL